MKILRLKHDYSYATRYPEDTARIVEACREHGYQIDPETAAAAWHRHSEAFYASGWAALVQGVAIAHRVLGQCVVEGEEEE